MSIFKRLMSFVAVGFLALSVSTMAMAQQPHDPGANIKGKWFATILVDGLPQPIFLNINKLVPGENGLIVSYSAPRDCESNGIYGGRVEAGHVFYRQGYCGFFVNADVSHFILQMTQSGALKLTVYAGKTVFEEAMATSQ